MSSPTFMVTAATLRGAALVVIEEVVGLWDVAVREEILVLGGGLPRAVRRLVMAHGEERLIRSRFLSQSRVKSPMRSVQ